MNLYDYTSYHVISDSNQYYLFDIYNMLLCSIDENTYYALHDKTFSSLPVQTQEKLILLAQNDCFFHQQHLIQAISHLLPFQTVI